MNAALPRLEDFEDETFDIRSADRMVRGATIDPYPLIHELHAKGDVHFGSYRELFEDTPDIFDQLGFKQNMIFGYDNLVRIQLDTENFGNHDVFKHFMGRTFGRSLTAMDAPEHMRFRKIFQKAFLPHTVARWSERFVEPVIGRLIERFAGRGEAELIDEFLHPYPFQIIWTQLGLEDDEQGRLVHKLAEAQLFNLVGLPQGEEAAAKLGAFFEALVAARLGEPGEDLVSHLATVEVDGERLPDDVLIGFLRQLTNAAGDTTYRSTSNLLVGLLHNPGQLAAVRQDRSLVPKAIEEALRWEGPIIRGWRYVKNDVEIAGHRLPRGSVVNTVRGSANRDPAKYEDPDRFDIHRDLSVRPIPFGIGPHVCIGQHLARLEMTRALNALLDRLPNLRLHPDYPPPQPIGHEARVPHAIHVRFDPA